MALKEEYIAKLERIPTVSFNKEQKQIAKKIIENTADNDLNAVYNLITQRVKTGFVFDEAPEVNHDAVALIKENRELGINIDFDGKLEHKLIIGENYDALKNLCATYIDKNGKGLIDVIYIDPPYNTEASKADGNDYKEEIKAEKFIYRDKFTRDGWLNMLNERLKLAKRLLSDTGVIFISIDDSEQAYLKVLCDEIFGEENFVGNLIWLKGNAQNDADNLQKNHEYILIIAKKNQKNLLSVETEKSIKVIQENGESFYEGSGILTGGAGGTLNRRPNLGYTIYYNPSTKDKIAVADYDIEKAKTNNIEDEVYKDNLTLLKKGYIKIRPPKKGNKLGRWTWKLNKFNEERDKIYIKETSLGYSVVKKIFIDAKQKKVISEGPLKSFINISSSNGTKELEKLLNERLFGNPKPIELITYLIKGIKKQDSTILDFYAGSGTTGQAVMELNEEDGGKRKFILVTNNENGIGEKITRERLYRVINGKGSNGEKIEWTYTKEKPYLTNNAVRVFNIETTELTLQDLEKAEELKEKAKLEFKKLNENYHPCNDFDIYNDLSALNPQKQNDGEK